MSKIEVVLLMMPLFTSSMIRFSMLHPYQTYLKIAKFTYEQEKNKVKFFLKFLFIRDDEKINTTIYRKDTHNGLYMHCKLFMPISWKRGMPKSLIELMWYVLKVWWQTHLVSQFTCNTRVMVIIRWNQPLGNNKLLTN